MQRMEISAYGDSCIRARGKEGVVVADAFPSIVGPTGRGLTADIATYSRPDWNGHRPTAAAEPTLGLVKSGARKADRRRGAGAGIPTSLEPAFVLDAPGEFEVHQVLITGVRTFRDDSRGSERGMNTCFVYELDGLHLIHLGDIGHLLDEDMLGEVGTVEVACVPVGGSLPAARAAELVAQLGAKLVVPMLLGGSEGNVLGRFLHELSVQHSEAVPKLAVTISSLPQETTVVLLEPRGRA
jgi:hypothetical protein